MYRLMQRYQQIQERKASRCHEESQELPKEGSLGHDLGHDLGLDLDHEYVEFYSDSIAP
jgi:hypothetical protein